MSQRITDDDIALHRKGVCVTCKMSLVECRHWVWRYAEDLAAAREEITALKHLVPARCQKRR